MESVDICNHFKEPLYQRGLSSESHLHQLNAMRFAAFSIWDAVQALVGTSLCGWRIEPSTHKNKLKISGNKWTFKQKGETNKIDQHRFDTSFRFGVQPVQLGVSPSITSLVDPGCENANAVVLASHAPGAPPKPPQFVESPVAWIHVMSNHQKPARLKFLRKFICVLSSYFIIFLYFHVHQGVNLFTHV
jgi:hypothetical protein